MFERLISIDPNSDKSFFLFGPRGTGKTTWLHKHFANAIHIDLLSDASFRKLASNPSELESLIPAKSDRWVVIDEVQKVPALLNEVHRLIESRGEKFVLTGSSARSLRRSGTNLLAGRALNYRMHPITAVELGGQFNLEESLQYGHLPARFDEANVEKYLESYVNTYVKEEVMQEGLTRSIGDFHRFCNVASFSQAGLVNVTHISRESALGRSTVASYFSILEDLLLSFELPVFSLKAKRKLIQRRKFFFFDVGVFRTLRPKGPLDEGEVNGPAVETLVAQELRAINDYFDLKFEIFYWRTKAGLEVDFVLYGEKGLIAIEVKAGKLSSSKQLRGLREFKIDYPVAKTYVFHGGTDIEYHDHITAIPLRQALPKLPEILQDNF